MSKKTYKLSPIGKRLVEKWNPLVRDIDDTYTQVNTAILLENEAQKGNLLMEDSSPGTTTSGQSAGGIGFGATQGAGNDIAPFQHYLLPLVRRVYPNLIANELVGVQPMTSPASLIFYLKYRYSGLVESKASITTGKISDVGVHKGQTAADTEYGNFIGNSWNIDPYYSLQKVFREAVTSTPVVIGATTVVGSFATYTLLATPKIESIPVTVRWVLTDGTDTVVIAAEKSTSGTQVGPYLVSSTTAGIVTGLSAGTLAVTATTVTSGALSYGGGFVATGGSISATYEYNMENNRLLPEIELEISSKSVESRTRKLRTKWTVEASQDLRAMHNIDAEQELVALLANEVTAEIDREIINDLIINALIRVNYNYSHPFLVGGSDGGGGFGVGISFAIPGATNFDDRNKALFYQILEVSNQIYRQSLRGAGNWVVTSPEVAAKLESLLEFKPDARTDFQYNLGISMSGTLNGQFKLFKDPLFPRDLILVGYKGSSFMDAGFFYCPYVPLQMTPTVLDPETFNPRKGLITRYGTAMVENGARMYGVIRVNGLTAIGADSLPGADSARLNPDGTSPSLTSVAGPGNPSGLGSELI